MEFLFSGQWLDESNEGAPFSSLSCPATAVFLRGRSLTKKFRRDYFSQFGWHPRKPRNLITLGNLYPYGNAEPSPYYAVRTAAKFSHMWVSHVCACAAIRSTVIRSAIGGCFKCNTYHFTALGWMKKKERKEKMNNFEF